MKTILKDTSQFIQDGFLSESFPFFKIDIGDAGIYYDVVYCYDYHAISPLTKERIDFHVIIECLEDIYIKVRSEKYPIQQITYI